MALATVAAVAPTLAQDATDPFRDSDFDGHWTGSLRVSGVDLPVAINLSILDHVALASVMLPDAADRADAFEPFPTDVQRRGSRRLDLLVDTGRAGNGVDAAKLVITYKRASDSIRVKAKGALRGKGDLRRSSAEAPLRAIWGGDLLLALDERTAGRDQPGITEVTGFSWSADADLRGVVVGRRSGSTVDLTLSTRIGELAFAGELRTANTELRGELSSSAQGSGPIAMRRASGLGAIEVGGFSPATVTAGATSSVIMTGRNFAEGLQVDTDVDGVSVIAVQVESPRQALLTVAVDAAVAIGTAIGLRVRNADGQASIDATALAVKGGPPGLLSFAADIEPILANGCTYNNCHTMQKAPQTAGLVLAQGAYDNTVKVASTQQPWLMRIEPGNADASYLVKKIRGDADIEGAQMPRDGPGLLPGEVQMIIDWVNQGASNNRPSR